MDHDRRSLVESEDWYHCIDLGDGIVTNGIFDIRPVLENYCFPQDMRGMSVLDIGRSSGFFSFEFERRGATVTATDLPSNLDKDYVGGAITKRLLRRWMKPELWSGPVGVRTDFDLAHRLMGSKVERVDASLADLSPDMFGGRQFDLVFVGSVLNHVRDPAGALQRIFSITGDRCIIANPIDAKDRSDEPRMRLVGLKDPGLTTWLLPNLPCLVHLVRAAGFVDVEVKTPHFTLASKDNRISIPHAVIHARRGTQAETERPFIEIMKSKYAGIDRI